MATHSELLKGLKNWLVGLIAKSEGFVTTSELVKSAEIPFAIVNRVLYEERDQNGAVIEVGELDGEQAYRFIGTAAEVPSQKIDIEQIRDVLSGRAPSKSATAKKKASTKRAAAKKTGTKKSPTKKAPAKKVAAKKKAPAVPPSKPAEPATTTPEFDLDVAALVIGSPKHVVDIAEMLNVSQEKVRAATASLEGQGLVKAVTMELGDEVTITPTKKLHTEYRRKLDADEVIARYQQSLSQEEATQEDPGIKNTAGLGRLTALQATILAVAAEKDIITQNDLISETEILYPKKIDRLDISEDIIGLADDGMLETGHRGRTIVYSVPGSVEIDDLMLHAEEQSNEPEHAENSDETDQHEHSDDLSSEQLFIKALMETLGIQASDSDEENRLSVIEETNKMVKKIQRIKLMASEA